MKRISQKRSTINVNVGKWLSLKDFILIGLQILRKIEMIKRNLFNPSVMLFSFLRIHHVVGTWKFKDLYRHCNTCLASILLCRAKFHLKASNYNKLHNFRFFCVFNSKNSLQINRKTSFRDQRSAKIDWIAKEANEILIKTGPAHQSDKKRCWTPGLFLQSNNLSRLIAIE